MPFAHLHVRSWFSFLAGGSSPEDLVARAAALGQPAMALTDQHGVYGAVRFQQACRAEGIHPVLGAEVRVEGHTLVLLAANRDGYANLCVLLTDAHQRSREEPQATLNELRRAAPGLFCLTGTRESFLWHLLDTGAREHAQAWVHRLRTCFGNRLCIEVAHHLLPGDTLRVRRLAALAASTGVPLLATGDVRYAAPEDYRRYDLMTCIREGTTLFTPHPARPRNAEAYVKGEALLRRLIPHPAAFEQAATVARACRVDLLPDYLTLPASRINGHEPAPQFLRRVTRESVRRQYTPAARPRALKQLAHELNVIGHLELDEFFLVVHEIVQEARRRGIRCAGRGSAANSIVAFLLGITSVDPLEHRLLFERFLHGGRRGTPDIDVDFDSERREEVIAWMEERFGMEQTAMTATLITYRLRSALRDTAKALGWPQEVVNRIGKAVPHGSATRAGDHRVALERVLGQAPLVGTLLTMAASLAGCPRHLGLHSGGMILSRTPLYRFTPVQVSANGVKVVQFDKEDVEALGLVKFDVLGLRMLATLSEAVEIAARHTPLDVDIDAMPLRDAPTFNMIRAGRTVGCFQIESQGQMHLLGQHQPETFDDLITEIALFRPGPLQGGMVHPFVRRRKGKEPVRFDHPDLEPILADTYGIILFQEQVLEVAHRFAGMSLEEADAFRTLMSRFRDPGEMERMRDAFVQGAMGRGVAEPVAVSVFEKVSKFVGYGFCRSHAAAFAKTVFQSAYFKRHRPAAFMAALMQHRPGMYNLLTLEEEARRFGVETRAPDLNRSGVRYDLERRGNSLFIRKPLVAVKGIGAEEARRVVWERLQQPFKNLQDAYERVALDKEGWEALAQSGALDSLTEGDSRHTLWEVGLLIRRLGPSGQRPTPALFAVEALRPDDVPNLPPLTHAERLSWDYRHGAPRQHPMTLVRRSLSALEVRPIELCYRASRWAGGATVTVAGVSMLRQRPPTANGVLFITLEDETGFIQCVVRPHVQEHLDHVLRSGALIVQGELSVAGNWRGLLVRQAWRLDGIFGGYEGHLDYAGGRDHLVTAVSSG